jgi:hypothetical protein
VPVGCLRPELTRAAPGTIAVPVLPAPDGPSISHRHLPGLALSWTAPPPARRGRRRGTAAVPALCTVRPPVPSPACWKSAASRGCRRLCRATRSPGRHRYRNRAPGRPPVTEPGARSCRRRASQPYTSACSAYGNGIPSAKRPSIALLHDEPGTINGISVSIGNAVVIATSKRIVGRDNVTCARRRP